MNSDPYSTFIRARRRLGDAEFHPMDDFVIRLDGFEQRFASAARS